MVRELFVRTLVLAICGWAGSAAAVASNDIPRAEIDWPAFLARQDLVWQRMPARWREGAFLGNGLLGTVIFQDGPKCLNFEMGRSDVTEHRRDNHRLPIGRMRLQTEGTILAGTMRLDLWNAEATGIIKTDRGEISFRSFIHTELPLLIVELDCAGSERDAKFSWQADATVDECLTPIRLTSDPQDI